MPINHDGSSAPSSPYTDRVRRATLDPPFQRLAAGWRDFLAAPATSLCYGSLFAIVGVPLTFGLWRSQAVYMLLPQ